MTPFQKTIGREISISGIGLHGGKRSAITLRPATENTGYLFVIKDAETPIEISAGFDMVVDTVLATTIGRDGYKISTIEHLIAALRGMDVDNVIVEVDGCEVPIMDGSAAPFVYLIKRAGVVEQKRLRKYIVVNKTITFQDGDKYIKISPFNDFEISFTIDFPHPAIGRQSLLFSFCPENFENEIARARTFGFLKEVEYLKSKGLALGGSLENAVVIGNDGIINQEGLRMKDEFVRHKVLDLIGDIALLGYPVLGKIEAFKSGHDLNNKLCRELFENREDFKVIEFGFSEPADIIDYQHSFSAV